MWVHVIFMMNFILTNKTVSDALEASTLPLTMNIGVLFYIQYVQMELDWYRDGWHENALELF